MTVFDTKMAQSGIQPLFVVEIDFSSGTKYYSTIDLDFLSTSIACKGKVLSAGSFRRAIHDYLSVFESNDVAVELANHDAEFSKLLATDTVKNVACRIKFGEATLSLDDFVTILSGKIDSYSMGDRKFSLVARDLFASLPEYPSTGYVDATTFPSAYPLHMGRPIPVCYGTHANVDPLNYENDGGWPTIYVDNTAGAYKFLIAGHAIKSIDAVYGWGGNGLVSEATLTTSFGLSKFKAGTLNGQTMAYLLFTSLPVDSDGYLLDIRVDVQGKEFNGDGTGTLMDNPLDVLNDFLSNYLNQTPLVVATARSYLLDDETAMPATYPLSLGTEYEGSGYLCDESTGLFSNGDPGYELTGDTEASNDPVWQEFEELGYTAKGGIIEQEKSDSILLSFCQSFNIRLFENRDGSLQVYFFDPSPPSDAKTFTEENDILAGSWSVDFISPLQMTQGNQIVNLVNYKHTFHWRNSLFSQASQVEDTDSQTEYGDTYPLDIELKWNGSADGAEDVANRILYQFADPVSICHFTTGLRGVTLELAEKVEVTHAEAPSVDGLGWSDAACEIQDIEYDLSQMAVRVTGLVYDPAMRYVLGDENSMSATWLLAQGTADEEFGYLCDETTGLFSNGDEGKTLF